jgi:beta-glucanase (GH16 family)
LTCIIAFCSVFITLCNGGVTVDFLNLRRMALLPVPAATVLLTLTGILPAQAAAAPRAPAGWTTVFQDRFDGPAGSAPALERWFYDIGPGRKYGMGEADRTTRSTANVFLDGDGHLVLKATRSDGRWTSGRIETTRDDFTAPAGGEMEMTASIELPAGADALGYWPAFWAVGAPTRAGGAWPLSGELDMMEDVNGMNDASQTMHDAAGSTGTGLIPCPATGCAAGFHAYSVIVNRARTRAEYLQFLIDGRVQQTITEAEVGATAWEAAVDHGFYIILDLAIGGTYPDLTCQCTTPAAATTAGASMKVASVAVQEKGGDSTPASRPLATGPARGLNGWCLDNRDSLDTTANVVDAAGCRRSPGQQWSAYSDGTLRTEGGCLGFWGATADSGSWVDWYPCNGTAAQAWTRDTDGELVNAASGLCLTVPGGRQAVQLDIETCAGSASQHWSKP